MRLASLYLHRCSKHARAQGKEALTLLGLLPCDWLHQTARNQSSKLQPTPPPPRPLRSPPSPPPASISSERIQHIQVRPAPARCHLYRQTLAVASFGLVASSSSATGNARTTPEKSRVLRLAQISSPMPMQTRLSLCRITQRSHGGPQAQRLKHLDTASAECMCVHLCVCRACSRH